MAERTQAARPPGDEQMARWYDLDQRYLRREVLAEHRMEHRDILFSFFLVEGVPGCVRAKVKNGPPRYSQYRQTFYVPDLQRGVGERLERGLRHR